MSEALQPDGQFGPCMTCGGPQSRNPHPDAGSPTAAGVEVGYSYACIPCLVRARNRAQRKVRAALAWIAEHGCSCQDRHENLPEHDQGCVAHLEHLLTTDQGDMAAAAHDGDNA